MPSTVYAPTSPAPAVIQHLAGLVGYPPFDLSLYPTMADQLGLWRFLEGAFRGMHPPEAPLPDVHEIDCCWQCSAPLLLCACPRVHHAAESQRWLCEPCRLRLTTQSDYRVHIEPYPSPRLAL